MSTDAAELSVYTSPHFTDFERRIFIDNLSVKSVEFSAGENAQIFCRCLIHDTSKPTDSQPLPSGIKLGSETILCLHGFERLTTSWVWIKFAATLFRQGFNVIMMDSPGFGKSSIARDIRCPLRSWKGWDAQLVTMFLAKLSISRVNVMACYEGASTFLNLLLDSAIILGKNHYLHNVCCSLYLFGDPSRFLKKDRYRNQAA
jgi:pimeloyl-ACP methyl ester carboxylesterase